MIDIDIITEIIFIYKRTMEEKGKSFENKLRNACQNTQKSSEKNVKNGKNDIKTCNFVDKNVFIN